MRVYIAMAALFAVSADAISLKQAEDALLEEADRVIFAELDYDNDGVISESDFALAIEDARAQQNIIDGSDGNLWDEFEDFAEGAHNVSEQQFLHKM